MAEITPHVTEIERLMRNVVGDPDAKVWYGAQATDWAVPESGSYAVNVLPYIIKVDCVSSVQAEKLYEVLRDNSIGYQDAKDANRRIRVTDPSGVFDNRTVINIGTPGKEMDQTIGTIRDNVATLKSLVANLTEAAENRARAGLENGAELKEAFDKVLGIQARIKLELDYRGDPALARVYVTMDDYIRMPRENQGPLEGVLGVLRGSFEQSGAKPYYFEVDLEDIKTKPKAAGVAGLLKSAGRSKSEWQESELAKIAQEMPAGEIVIDLTKALPGFDISNGLTEALNEANGQIDKAARESPIPKGKG